MRRFIVTPTALKQILLTAFVLSLTVAGCASTEKADTTDPEQVYARNKAQVKRWYGEIFGKYDISKAHEVISPKLTTNNRPSTGDAIKELPTFFKWAKAHFDEVETVQEQFIAEGNWVARRYTLKLIYYPGGNAGEENAYKGKVTIKGMGFYEFDENGLMIQNYHIENTAEQLAKIDAEYAQKKQSDLESRNKEQAKRFYAEFISAQDISKADEFLSPHFTIDDRGDDGVQEKPTNAIEHFRGLFKLIAEGSSEFVLTPDEMVAEGNTVAVRWHQTALLRPKEPVEQNPMTKRLNWTGMSFLEFDQKGLILKARVIQIEDKSKEERVQNQQ